jgi:hypothetical protein
VEEVVKEKTGRRGASIISRLLKKISTTKKIQLRVA